MNIGRWPWATASTSSLSLCASSVWSMMGSIDVGRVVPVGVLHEHGPFAVDVIRGCIWNLLVLDREVEQQISLEFAVEPPRVVASAAAQPEAGAKPDGVQRAHQRGPGHRRSS